MSEQTEVNYLDGEVVWVKLGSCWWPGEVVGHEKLPPDVLPSFRKPPIAIVKFFQEDSYEYVKNQNSIYKYNCSRKDEFIQKGLYLYRTKHGLLEKFPEDVIRAETAVGGDIEILTRDEFQETKKESYAGLFGNPNKKTPGSSKKGKSGKGRSGELSKFSTPIRKIKEKSNYRVHILVQGSKTPKQTEETTPSTSRAGSEPSEEKSQEINVEDSPKSATTPTVSSSGVYACHACPFTTMRLNVLILHNKTHSATFTPYTPSPIKKKLSPKVQKSSTSPKTPKPRKPRQDKVEKLPRKNHAQKREAEAEALLEIKKIKTDEEIKSSLLADWDDGDDDSNGESSTIAMTASPDVPIAAGSPAVPTPAELPSAQVPSEVAPLPDKKKNEDKPESSNDAKYEFCEDEDWPVEADVGRKIPRIKKPLIRKEEKKSLSIDEDDMAREVAELLNKTIVPELPSVPEPLKVEENFPEPSIVKSPDKSLQNPTEKSQSPEKKVSDFQPPKTIFKTKTFFRSRHSRSQDAIGKYVAEQLNAAERHDIVDNEMNGSDITLSPEPRISSPIEHVKVARLAPKIQLKKMNAEAAQWREREKYQIQDDKDDKETYSKSETLNPEKVSLNVNNTITVENESKEKCATFSSSDLEIAKSDEKCATFTSSDMEIANSDEKCASFTSSDLEIAKSDEKVSDIKDITENVNDNETNEPNYKLDFITNRDEYNEPINNSNTLEKPNSPEKCSKEAMLQLSEQNKQYEQYMSESTASAVDALLSVSREADRVTKVISVDPPEDLFEDDNKESANEYDINSCEDKLKEIKSNSIKILDQDFESTDTTMDVEISKIDNNPNEVPSQKVISESKPDNEENFKEEKLFCSTDLNSHKNIEKTDCIEQKNVLEIVSSSTPSESDLQIAEALINLPSTTIQNKIPIECQDKITLISPTKNEELMEIIEISQNDTLDDSAKQNEIDKHADENTSLNAPILTNTIRFESEEEKSENLNAAQSLVQMSESIDHKINITEINSTKQNEIGSRLYCKVQDVVPSIENITEKKLVKLSENISETINGNTVKAETTSRLLKILEDPCSSKVSITNNAVVNKKVIVSNKEKLLNIDVAKSALKPKPQSTKQKIIIRRTTPNKTLLNNVTEVTTPDKIILSRSNKPSEDGSSVQSYTIQTTPDVPTDSNTIIIQQKIRKIAKPNPKLQKIKPQLTPVTSVIDIKTSKEALKPNEAVFDINSMPIVLSEDILTPESIEKMPFVMSDGNLITTSNNTKVSKHKKVITNSEKITVTSSSNKQDLKAHNIHHPPHEVNKVTTPNILSKSTKLRGSAKPMLVIDKTTGKQQIIMAKSDPPTKEVKQSPTIMQTLPQSGTKTDKFIILPSASSPRPGRTQKIVIDPQTGKAHVVVGKGPETTATLADNKPVSAKLLPSASDTNAPGNTVMIITNAQGTQSRIVLTPEHEKILFPNKQQPSVSQLKTITQRISTNASIQQKNVVTTVASLKSPTRILSKQKSAIITSKGQLIVGGRLTTTTQNIAPLPEIRPAPKRIQAEPKKTVHTIQKNSSEPLIFLQKSGAVMQLTAAQFEHLQRTGQIIQKVPVQPQENKLIVQKTITISPNDTLVPVQKQRVRKHLAESPTPMKKIKHEIAIAPAPAPVSPMPALTPICSTNISGSNMNNTKSIPSSSNYSKLDHFEELLPTSAIARPTETIVAQTEPVAQPAAPLSDGQLLAVPGEHFGGPQGSFYLCVEENGTFTPIDNRPLVLENNQLVPMAEPVPVIAPQPERRDILEAALANSDVFHAESAQNDAPDFRDLNANVSVHCRVSETSTTLNQPIMTPVEVPTKVDVEPAIPSSLDDGLAVIGVTPHSVPTSLELPITVTDPRIAPKTTDPLSNSNYRTSLLPSPNTEMTFVVTEGPDIPAVGPISMPLLTEEESVGKSMPILTDEITERTISSVESTVGSPSSIDVRESETEDSQWPRRLLTPGSDISEASVEIPLQPAIQISVNDLSHNNS